MSVVNPDCMLEHVSGRDHSCLDIEQCGTLSRQPWCVKLSLSPVSWKLLLKYQGISLQANSHHQSGSLEVAAQRCMLFTGLTCVDPYQPCLLATVADAMPILCHQNHQ